MVVFLFLSCCYLVSIFSINEANKEATNEINKQCSGDLELAQLPNESLNMTTVCKWDFVNGKKTWHNEIILLFFIEFTCYFRYVCMLYNGLLFYLYFFKIYFWITQGFQYFSGIPVLHYLHAVLFIKILTIFMNILYNTLWNQEVP